SDGEAFSVGSMLSEIRGKQPEIFHDVPKDGNKVQKTVSVNLLPVGFTIAMETGPIQVNGVDLTLELFVETIHVPISKFIAYSDEEKRLLIAGEARANIMGETVVFTAFQMQGMEESPLAISVEPGCTLRPFSMTITP